MDVPVVPPKNARSVRQAITGAAFAAIAILSATVLISYMDRPVAHAQVDATTAVHFLEQASFGPTALEVTAVQGIGPAAWIDQQMAMPESPLPDGLDGNAVRAQLYLNMATGPDQLRQRVMFALSQTIVVSANKVTSGEELTPWVRLLSRNAFGNYRQLLREVSLSPTMGRYLDNVYNRKATATTSPNENYARELLQLFSIGTWDLNRDGSQRLDGGSKPIPSYKPGDDCRLRAGAHGWTTRRGPVRPRATTTRSTSSARSSPTSTASRHDTDAEGAAERGGIAPGTTAAFDLDRVMDSISITRTWRRSWRCA